MLSQIVNSYCLACWWIVQIITPRSNYFPREIIPPRGDNLHYPPTSQAITVLLYRTFNSKRQNHKTRANLNVLTRCQLDSLPFVARLCFISVVTAATLLLSLCWHVRVCVHLLAQRNTVALLHYVRTDFHCCTLLCHGIINSYCQACWWIVQIITPRRNYFPRATPEGNNSFEGW